MNYNVEPNSVTDIFGSQVFNEVVMRQSLPKKVFEALQLTIREGTPLDPSLADIVASAMKDWALRLGATHYCHWFQPMTGNTAEKHEAFISPTVAGNVIMEFSGKNLVQGEPDASSFPSGGLRATFEARGYTGWDTTSPVFVRKNGNSKVLYIPSVFCSYNGDALDKKTPLLRSMEALNFQSLRILRALGDTTTKRVLPTVGAEQEYFLVDRKFAEQRNDLLLTGRTLFGAPPSKGQDLEDQYFGAMPERVASFMDDVNKNLWQLGVSAKTQHNETAPGQYELAPIYTTANIAVDWNQLTMSVLKSTALKHDFVCLVHEKPFQGINGSGKHLNWSLITDDGRNLLEPGDTPQENSLFLIFLCAVIRAVDMYSELLRASVAVPGNDYRLGGNEAPPVILSIYLGEEITNILNMLVNGEKIENFVGEKINLGVDALPPLPRDTADRNRTSPFAFTGNKFEFRMPGSSQSPSDSITVINTIVADIIDEIANYLEQKEDKHQAVIDAVVSVVHDNSRIIFNGDNYSKEWYEEAQKRGLPNINNGLESLLFLQDNPMYIELYESHKVLTKSEYEARVSTSIRQYTRTVMVEARTLLRIVKQNIIPSLIKYMNLMSQTMVLSRDAGYSSGTIGASLKSVTSLLELLDVQIGSLKDKLDLVYLSTDINYSAKAVKEDLIPAMAVLRNTLDKLERIVDPEYWKIPSYADMLFKLC